MSQRFEFETTTELLEGLAHMAESCDMAAENHADSPGAARFWRKASTTLYAARRTIELSRIAARGGDAEAQEGGNG